jgi:hypothetical protein
MAIQSYSCVRTFSSILVSKKAVLQVVANTFIDLELVCLFVCLFILCWGTVVVWSGSLNINGNRQNNRYFCSKDSHAVCEAVLYGFKVRDSSVQ